MRKLLWVVAGLMVLLLVIVVLSVVVPLKSGEVSPVHVVDFTATPAATADACAAAMQELAGAQPHYDQLPSYLKDVPFIHLPIDTANNHVAEHCH